MSVTPGTYKVGSTASIGRTKLARNFYDFAVEGGATGDIVLRGDRVPSGAIVTEAIIVVDTVLTSAGAATVALKTEAAADINAADAISGAPWSTTGAKRADALVGADKGIKTTAARTLSATVGTAALTAGKFSVVVSYMELT